VPNFINSAITDADLSEAILNLIKNSEIKIDSLKECFKFSGQIDLQNSSINILNKEILDNAITAKVGFQFQEYIDGCICSDNDYDSETFENNYCEFRISISNKTDEIRIDQITSF
jgi:aryl-phospho-beta-D-glucosidase BglC (GH1 family)